MVDESGGQTLAAVAVFLEAAVAAKPSWLMSQAGRRMM
jgi:hypothetical protein